MIVDCYSMFSFISPWAFICIELPNFIQIEPPRRAVMTSYRFFGYLQIALVQKGRNLFAHQISIIHGWNITTSRFGK